MMILLPPPPPSFPPCCCCCAAAVRSGCTAKPTTPRVSARMRADRGGASACVLFRKKAVHSPLPGCTHRPRNCTKSRTVITCEKGGGGRSATKYSVSLSGSRACPTTPTVSQDLSQLSTLGRSATASNTSRGDSAGGRCATPISDFIAESGRDAMYTRSLRCSSSTIRSHSLRRGAVSAQCTISSASSSTSVGNQW